MWHSLPFGRHTYARAQLSSSLHSHALHAENVSLHASHPFLSHTINGQNAPKPPPCVGVHCTPLIQCSCLCASREHACVAQTGARPSQLFPYVFPHFVRRPRRAPPRAYRTLSICVCVEHSFYKLSSTRAFVFACHETCTGGSCGVDRVALAISTRNS